MDGGKILVAMRIECVCVCVWRALCGYGGSGVYVEKRLKRTFSI